MDKVYIVTDVGQQSPTAGVIYQVFSNYDSAKNLLDKINKNKSKFGLYSDEDVNILEFKVL